MLNPLLAFMDVLLKIFAAISLFILVLGVVLPLIEENMVGVEYSIHLLCILSPQKSAALGATAKARE